MTNHCIILDIKKLIANFQAKGNQIQSEACNLRKYDREAVTLTCRR